jgi:hypothetical protein
VATGGSGFKVANMLRRGNGNVIEEDRSTGQTTEREGHVGTLGSVQLVLGHLVGRGIRRGPATTLHNLRSSAHCRCLGLD